MHQPSTQPSTQKAILRFNGSGDCEPVRDTVVSEVQLRLVANGAELLIASVLPGLEREFAYGILHSAGHIACAQDVKSFEFEPERGVAFIEISKLEPLSDLAQPPTLLGSACGADPVTISTHKLAPLSAQLLIEPAAIIEAARTVQRNSALFHETGGVHSVALYQATGEELMRADDIGRHNAFDKVMGAILLRGGIDPSQCFAVCTGRLSSEIVIKCWRAGIPVLVSRSCATSRALEIAGDACITLVGFARGKRMNVYSRPERVVGGLV